MKLKIILYLILISVFFIECENISEPDIQVVFRNGDFEYGEPIPDYWNLNYYNSGIITLETEAFFSGKRSIRIDNPDIPSGSFSTIFQTIIDFPDKIFLKFSAYVKTENIIDGSAKLHVSFIDDEGHQIKLDTTKNEIRNVVNWEKCEVISEIPQQRCLIILYLILNGEGTAWFDKVEVEFAQSGY